MKPQITEGDLLSQPVDAIVNAWNRNLIPWWLLLPQGISGAIKKKAGLMPFKELRRKGVLPLGGAVVTSAGRLPYKGIIHVAGIGHTWTSSENSIRISVRSALREAALNGFHSVGFPLIGAGTGGFDAASVEQFIVEEIEKSSFEGECIVVRFKKTVHEINTRDYP